MGWFSKTLGTLREKLNPAQERIAQGSGTTISTDQKIAYKQAFDKIEFVNRGVSMIVNACASLDYDVKDKMDEGAVPGMRQKSLLKLLNTRPNPYQSAQEFRKNLFTDFILEGNAFIYFDGAFIYHLPAAQVEILTDEKTFIKGYRYNGTVDFKESEVFSFKDLSSSSIYRGSSRLESASKSVNTLYSMQQFQESFFDNGAVFGLILTTENTLSQVAKEKTINYWTQKYSPRNGGKRPVILDSGLKPHTVTESNFKDMDFDQGIKTHNEKILQALGVPPILLSGGNNANIAPNLRLFYLETVLPIVRGFVSAIERYFGYDVEAVTTTVSALQPELRDIASYHATLVNSGIITPNEARKELRFEAIAGHDELRLPANISGSAANPSIGGKPPQPKEKL
jgi:HK97 family phage portal protein